MKVVDVSAKPPRVMSPEERERAARILGFAFTIGTMPIAAQALLDAIILCARRTPAPAAALKDAIGVLETALSANYGVPS